MSSQTVGHMTADNEATERHFGRLTGYRCPKCGACLYLNLAGAAWCGDGCGWKDGWVDLNGLAWTAVPPDHPHLEEGDSE